MSTAESGDLTLGQPAPAVASETQLVPPTLSPPAPVEPPAQPVQPVAPAQDSPTPPMPVSDMPDVPLGTLIFREGLLTEERFEEALQDGMQRGKRLGEVLLERGLVSENDLGRLLAGQKGLPFVQLDSAVIDPTAVQLLPVEKARLHSVLPIGFREGLPVVAVADPSNDLVIENVRRALNCEPHLVVAGREALHRQIETAYGAALVALEPEPDPVAPVAPVQPVVAEPVDPPTPVADQPVAPPPSLVEPVVRAEPVLHVEPVADPPAPVETPVAASEPVFAAEPAVPEPLVEEPAPVVEPAPAQDEDAEVVMSCMVALRLADGESVDIRAFDSAADAKDYAKMVVEEILSGDGWPFFDGRFIRPEAIVSVDLIEPEGRWLGSATRRAAREARQQHS